mmetsp:Transcript_65553/g.102348  ORF Transcript_65553/g.102348 Transcript_65553/m.102348 type:complete len:81 (-) Transcript_65553:1889-2131(-)
MSDISSNGPVVTEVIDAGTVLRPWSEAKGDEHLLCTVGMLMPVVLGGPTTLALEKAIALGELMSNVMLPDLNSVTTGDAG